MKKSSFFLFGMLAALLAFGLILAGCDTGASTTPAPVPVPPVSQAAFEEMLADSTVKTINLTSSTDVTIPDTGITATGFTINVPSGALVRDYWKVGQGNKVVASAGGSLRWGSDDTQPNLLVGGSASAANVKLGTGATFTVIGGADNTASYEVSGPVTLGKHGDINDGAGTYSANNHVGFVDSEHAPLDPQP